MDISAGVDKEQLALLRKQAAHLMAAGAGERALKIFGLVQDITGSCDDGAALAEAQTALGQHDQAIALYRELIRLEHRAEHVARLKEIWTRAVYDRRPQWYRDKIRFLNNNPDFCKYDIGDYSYSPGLNIDTYHTGSTLRVGRYCSIAGGVQIFMQQEHNVASVSTYNFTFLPGFPDTPPLTRGDVTIGNDVWIGAYTRIMSGVTIHDGAVIGAGALVARDIPPYAVAVGVPARVVRSRYAPEVVERLLAARWWDKPLERLRPLGPLLVGEDVEALLAAL